MKRIVLVFAALCLAVGLMGCATGGKCVGCKRTKPCAQCLAKTTCEKCKMAKADCKCPKADSCAKCGMAKDKCKCK